jgi:prepilin-type N-terminal cleavage/methylation domain-containing protein
MNKKGYTLLEMIIVMIILTLLIWAFRSFAPNKNNKQVEFWNSCSQYIYQEITSEINSLNKDKIEIINWTGYYQSWKQIDISINEIKIIKKMTEIENNNEIEFTNMIISWNNCLDDNIKNTNNYLIKVDNAWYITYTPKNIIISGNNTFKISSCIDIWDHNTCIPTLQLIFNQAAQTINQKSCINFSWDDCNEWGK